MLQMMEKYANNLEELVEDKTQQCMEEKKKADMLLYSMMPVLVFYDFTRHLIPTSYNSRLNCRGEISCSLSHRKHNASFKLSSLNFQVHSHPHYVYPIPILCCYAFILC